MKKGLPSPALLSQVSPKTASQHLELAVVPPSPLYHRFPTFFPRIQAAVPAGIAKAAPPHLLRRFPLEQQVSRVNIAGEQNIKTQAQDPFLRGS